MTSDELERHRLNPSNWRGPAYRCAADPRVIVPMRARGTGYSVNYAHKAAIPVLLSMLAALGLPFLFLLLPRGMLWTAAAFVVVVGILVAVCHWESTRPRRRVMTTDAARPSGT